MNHVAIMVGHEGKSFCFLVRIMMGVRLGVGGSDRSEYADRCILLGLNGEIGGEPCTRRSHDVHLRLTLLLMRFDQLIYE